MVVYQLPEQSSLTEHESDPTKQWLRSPFPAPDENLLLDLQMRLWSLTDSEQPIFDKQTDLQLAQNICAAYETAYPKQRADNSPTPAQMRKQLRTYKWRLFSSRFSDTAAFRVLKVIALPLILILTKLKTFILLLSKVKFFGVIASMVISIGAYALFWGIPFAVGFVLLLLIHEMGHVIQLRREGIKASAPMFIPFLGAVVMMKQIPDDALVEARVGLAGPILGTIGTLIPLTLWLATADPFWQALAYVGFFINLFNLLPVSPLDGGRAMAAISPWVWAVGFVVLAGLAIAVASPILILICIVGGFESFSRFRRRKSEHEYFAVSKKAKAWVLAVYLLLAGATAWGTEATYIEDINSAEHVVAE